MRLWKAMVPIIVVLMVVRILDPMLLDKWWVWSAPLMFVAIHLAIRAFGIDCEKCPECDRKKFARVPGGVTTARLDWKCRACGHEVNTGEVIKTSWIPLAVLILLSVGLSAYLIARIG